MMQEGPDINGTWLNKNTGEKIEVVNSIYDGNDMILMTNIGQITMEDFSRNYIQVSEELYDESGAQIKDEQIINQTKKLEQEFGPPKQQRIIPQISQQEKNAKQQTRHKTETQDPKQTLLKTLFDKVQINPKLDITIECDNFPTNELKMLRDIYDVDLEEIGKYLIEHVFNKELLSINVAEFLERQFSEK